MGNNAGEGLRGAFQTLNIESTQSNGEADQIKADSASVTGTLLTSSRRRV